MPHRWRISFHPEAEICPKNRTCFQLIPNHMDGASQASANPPQPAELPCFGRAIYVPERWGRKNFVSKPGQKSA
jgi:hypothetical protein